MTDNLTPAQRRINMQSIRSRDTLPELYIRKFLHRLGFRFRTHASSLPGKPDIVLPKYKTVVFVHGCFWHRHGCKRTVSPKTRSDYWISKFARTQQRDLQAVTALRRSGWKVITVWECELAQSAILKRRFNCLVKAKLSVSASH